MKKVSWILGVFLCACGAGPSDQGNQNLDGTDTIKEFDMSEQRLSAVDFNNEMTFMQEGILSQVDVLFKSDSLTVDINLENTLFELELNLKSLENMKSPEGGDDFITAMENLMLFYRSEFSGPFQEIIPLLKKAEWTKADEKKVSDYDVNFVAQEKSWFDTVIVAQEQFAKSNNIKLQEE